MGSPSELSLDYKRSNGHASSMLQQDQAQKLEEFLGRLEEERLKIEAFKRELPLCMQLLNNAMEAYRQQLDTSCNVGQGTRPVIEEFIPIKQVDADHNTDRSSEKPSWMASAQLWTQQQAGEGINKQAAAALIPGLSKEEGSPKLGLEYNNKHRNGGGAFHPFSKDKTRGGTKVGADLALGSPEEPKSSDGTIDTSAAGSGLRREDSGGRSTVATTFVNEQASRTTGANPQPEGQSAPNQTHRKARRCWSPDLHRRFVHALQLLGGSQVATPKQIRELMKVDGLTNDEVKSHLQKYRLHTRRPIPAPQAAVPSSAPQLVVLGGIWVPPEYAANAAAAGATAIYGAHQAAAAAHYCAAPVPQDFYAAAASVPHLRHHPPPSPVSMLQHSVVTNYRTNSRASPDSNGAKDVSTERSTESIEDGEEGVAEEEGRSDSSSGGWKVEDKAIVSDRDDTHGSDVKLKF